MNTNFTCPNWRGQERCQIYDPSRGEDCARYEPGKGEAVAKYKIGDGEHYEIYNKNNDEECNCYKIIDIKLRIIVASLGAILAISWPMINFLKDFDSAFNTLAYGAYIPAICYISAASIGTIIAVWSERDHPLKVVLASLGIPGMVVSLSSLAIN